VFLGPHLRKPRDRENPQYWCVFVNFFWCVFVAVFYSNKQSNKHTPTGGFNNYMSVWLFKGEQGEKECCSLLWPRPEEEA